MSSFSFAAQTSAQTFNIGLPPIFEIGINLNGVTPVVNGPISENLAPITDAVIDPDGIGVRDVLQDVVNLKDPIVDVIDPKNPIPVSPLVLPGLSIAIDPNALLAPLVEKLDLRQTGGVLNQIGGLAQSTAGIVSTGGGLVDQLLKGGLGGNVDDGISSRLGDVRSGVSGNTINSVSSSSVTAPALSTFMISGVLVSSHDGFETKSSNANASGQTAEFDTVSYGFTTGVRTDASEMFGLDKGRVTFGFFGNFTHTDVDNGVNDALKGFGFDKGGEASVDSWSAGGFALVTGKAFYGMGVITGTFGQSDVTNLLIGAGSEFDTAGFSTSAVGGWLAPVGKTAKLDVSGRITYALSEVDDYADSSGTIYQDAELDDLSVTASARLFDSIPGVWAIYRPFIQTGLTQRLDHTNEIKIDGVKFEFDDADTTLFGRIGVDFEIKNSVQAYVALRGDVSEDAEAVAGQVGVTFKLD